MKKILVIGSSNMDMVMHVDQLPKPGETIGNGSFSQHHGGKGANQAVAAARAGGQVTFATAVGDDVFANAMISEFSKDAIDTSLIQKISNQATGTALIFVDKHAENCIGVAPGANASISPEYIDSILEHIKINDYLLIQQEIPKESVIHAISLAHQLGKHMILNTAPALPLPKETLSKVTTLVMNETETEVMSGFELTDLHASADHFLEQGVANVIITLGAKGSFIKIKNTSFQVPAHDVSAIDTVAAGDVYCGCLTASLARGNSLEDAVTFATAAAAISVTREGAQPSAPRQIEVAEFLKANS